MTDSIGGENDDAGDVNRPLSEAEMEQLRDLLAAAWCVAEPRIREVAGQDFLDGVLQDAAGEFVVQVCLKARVTRLCVHWPKFSPKLETVSELRTFPPTRRAS